MTDIRLSNSEWYPVPEPHEDGHLYTNLPDDVVARYLAAYEEFGAAWKALLPALKKSTHDAQISAARATRGQRRPHRRAHPERNTP